MAFAFGGQGSSRREFLALALAAGVAPRAAFAQEFPSRPIRVIVGVTPGGSLDLGARLVAQGLSEILKTPAVVENKPGGAGVLASEAVANSPADGYTLLHAPAGPIIIAPHAMPTVKFNPLTELAPVNLVSTSPTAVAVNPKLGVSTLKELVALSKTRPINMGLPLAGSLSHIVVEMIAKETGCDFFNIAYKGAAPALSDTLAGHVDATVGDLGVFLALHREKRIQIVTVTSETRMAAAPDVRTAHEDFPGLLATNWNGVFAPAKTPAPVIEKLSSALRQIGSRSALRAQYDKASITPASFATPAQFQKFVAEEYTRFGRIVRERNIVIS